MSLEIERKYLDANLDLIRSKLSGLGAASTGRHFERNFLYDTPARTLKDAGKLLRLRVNCWPDRIQTVLTMKLTPSVPDKAFKIKEELEQPVGDFAGMDAILQQLGYAPVNRYEKLREEFSLPYAPADEKETVKIALDATPFAEIVELEGSRDGIVWAEQLLGLAKCRKSSKSYNELFQDWLASCGGKGEFWFGIERLKQLWPEGKNFIERELNIF